MRLPEKNEPVCSIKDTDAFENAERLMLVTPREFFRYEMGCTPVKMMNSSPYFTMKMQCSGEGEKWTEEHQWMLVRMLDRDVLIQTSGRTNKRGIDLSSTVMEKCR